MQTIRFYGVRASLEKWRALVGEIIGRQGTEIRETVQHGITRTFYEVEMSAQDRKDVQDRLWYAESGTGHLATGRPYLWNDCITYDVR